MFESVVELFRYRSMIRNLVKREVRGRYKGSILGFLWNFITPFVQIFVYILVFTEILKVGLEHYEIYITSGMVIWIWFSESIGEGSGVLVANSDMMKKIYFPRSVLPISMVLSKMVNFIIMLGIYFIIIFSVDYGVSIEALLFLPITMVITFIFLVGFDLILSAVNVYLRDVQYITNVALMAWIWVTPIMYAATNIQNELLLKILEWNPMTYIVRLYQDAFYWKVIPDISTIAISVGIATVTLLVGIVIFRFLERDFAEVL